MLEQPARLHAGRFYEGTKSPDDRVGDLVRYMTASFGITALDEATYLWSGRRSSKRARLLRLRASPPQGKLAQFKKEDGHLYAIYGTPAESLCGLQVEQFRKNTASSRRFRSSVCLQQLPLPRYRGPDTDSEAGS